MTASDHHISIPNKKGSQDELDFQFLKEQGIAYLQALSGKVWTDYNEHDPGITILEVLCYAITDLGNRISLPIADLLAEPASETNLSKFFSSAENILPSRATSELDYRKLFIDIPGIRNCWLRIYDKTVYINLRDKKCSYKPFRDSSLTDSQKSEYKLKGLYTLLIDPETELTKSETSKLHKTIRDQFHANRNLCEDLVEIKTVDIKPICICAKIELEDFADEEQADAEIRLIIEDYFSPPVSFKSLKDQLNSGLSTDEIFDGPLLNSGFIHDEDLKQADLRREVHLSDIVNCISRISGVKVIHEIAMINPDTPSVMDLWTIPISGDRKPVLCQDSVFNFYKGILPLHVNHTKAQEIYEEKKNTKLAQNRNKIIEKLGLPSGTFTESSAYTSIQNDFPAVYGIGYEGLPGKVDEKRKAQAKQLQAYLLFFDQVLASYFAQLAEMKNLLWHDGSPDRTYFTQTVDDLNNPNELLTFYPENKEELSTLLFGQFDQVSERRNLFLDHLLARFAERFGTYHSLMKYLHGSEASKLIIDTKRAFLANYAEISQNRAGAFNYFHQNEHELWNTSNVSGLEKRIAALIGLKNFKRRNLSASLVEIYNSSETPEIHFRWRIRNGEQEVLLNSCTYYESSDTAEEELYFAVNQILTMQEDDIRNLDENTILQDETVLGVFLVQRSAHNRFSMDIINPSITDPDDVNRIIARQYSYYTSAALVKKAMLELLAFFREEFSEDGMFLVEHILLRPAFNRAGIGSELFFPLSSENKDCTCCLDQYSYRVSIILPGYTANFSDMNVRRFVEKVIREETPAHILPRICWVGKQKINYDDKTKQGRADLENDLLQFELAYRDFLIKETKPARFGTSDHLKKLLNAMNNLNTIYPSGHLASCSEDNNENPKVILGRTNLGTL